MQNSSSSSAGSSFRASFPGRRRRQWVSYFFYGCLYGSVVCVIMRCPVVNGVAQVHLAWQHKVIPS